MSSSNQTSEIHDVAENKLPVIGPPPITHTFIENQGDTRKVYCPRIKRKREIIVIVIVGFSLGQLY